MVVTSESLGNSTNSSARLGGPDQPPSLDFASPSVSLPTDVLRCNFIEGISPEDVMHIASALLSAALIWREYKREQREQQQHQASQGARAERSRPKSADEGAGARGPRLELAV